MHDALQCGLVPRVHGAWAMHKGYNNVGIRGVICVACLGHPSVTFKGARMIYLGLTIGHFATADLATCAALLAPVAPAAPRGTRCGHTHVQRLRARREPVRVGRMERTYQVSRVGYGNITYHNRGQRTRAVAPGTSPPRLSKPRRLRNSGTSTATPQDKQMCMHTIRMNGECGYGQGGGSMQGRVYRVPVGRIYRTAMNRTSEHGACVDLP